MLNPAIHNPPASQSWPIAERLVAFNGCNLALVQLLVLPLDVPYQGSEDDEDGYLEGDGGPV
jgi:hypothetical protein